MDWQHQPEQCTHRCSPYQQVSKHCYCLSNQWPPRRSRMAQSIAKCVLICTCTHSLQSTAYPTTLVDTKWHQEKSSKHLPSKSTSTHHTSINAKNHEPALLTTYNNIMIWTTCCLAYFGFLRVSEFTVPNQESYDESSHLSLKDISVDSHSNPCLIKVTIKQSKIDPFRTYISEVHIKMLGRWHNNDYQWYIKMPPQELAQLSKCLASAGLHEPLSKLLHQKKLTCYHHIDPYTSSKIFITLI